MIEHSTQHLHLGLVGLYTVDQTSQTRQRLAWVCRIEKTTCYQHVFEVRHQPFHLLCRGGWAIPGIRLLPRLITKGLIEKGLFEKLVTYDLYRHG